MLVEKGLVGLEVVGGRHLFGYQLVVFLIPLVVRVELRLGMLESWVGVLLNKNDGVHIGGGSIHEIQVVVLLPLFQNLLSFAGIGHTLQLGFLFSLRAFSLFLPQ